MNPVSNWIDWSVMGVILFECLLMIIGLILFIKKGEG